MPTWPIRFSLGFLAATVVACSPVPPTPTSNSLIGHDLTPTATLVVTPTPTAALVATPTPTIANLPQETSPRGNATLVSPGELKHLDVHQALGDGLQSMGPGIVYSRLVRLQTGSDVALPSLALECDLCRYWEQSDPFTYTFHLRPDIKWHNVQPLGGRDLTADDVVYSLERLRTPRWPGVGLLDSVDTIEATDDLVVRIRLKFDDPDFLLSLAHGQSKVVAPEAVNIQGDLRTGPVIGTGPWVFDSTNVNNRYLFKANLDYFEPELPGLERFRIQHVPDALIRLATILTDGADLTILDDAAWSYLLAQDSSVEYGVFPQPGTGILLGLRADREPFDNLYVRQALFRSLDPWEALKQTWGNRGSVQVGLPAISPDWLLSGDEVRLYLDNPSTVGELLSRSDTELPVSFALTVADFGDRYLDLGRAYEQMIKESGFEVSINVLNPRLYASTVWGTGDFQAFLGPMPPVYTPNRFLYGLIHSTGQWPVTGFVDETLDDLVERQSLAVNDRQGLVNEIQHQILREALLFMPATGTSLWVWQPRLRDFTPNFTASEYFHWARLTVRE
ncbi:MAG: ABC transporter substrate-binding protein [Chloroflexota bacterium]|nr:ABC transporter substrate-binding protein [Chloroflexota bacterium]